MLRSGVFIPCGGRDKLKEVGIGLVFSLWVLDVGGMTSKEPEMGSMIRGLMV